MDDATLQRFVRRHGLAKRLRGRVPGAEQNVVVAPPTYRAGYFMSIFADLLRREWMLREESFTFETVMSHPDRLDVLREARDRGYRTYLYYVCTNSAAINTRRIAGRVRQGGHDVPTQKVIERYDRSLALLPQALRICSRAYLFDTSGRKHRLIAEYEGGKLKNAADDLPQWFVFGLLRAKPAERR